ncbi:MAG: PD-(D/E)XK nuclease family protein [Candidatus Aenigmatarchaeota archaeon]
MLDFNKLIENHLTREFKPKTVGRYYPSEIGKCLRETWYSYKFPLPTPLDRLMIFEAGNIMHHFVAEVMRSDKNPQVKLLESELPFKISIRDFIISGRIDDLLLVVADNRRLLVEVKSTSRIDLTNEPQPQHMVQLQLYLHALKDSHQVSDGILLYVEKNTLQSKAFHVKYDERLAAEALDRFSKLHNFIAANSLPFPEARIRDDLSWMCRKCDFRERCFKETPDTSLKDFTNGGLQKKL